MDYLKVFLPHPSFVSIFPLKQEDRRHLFSICNQPNKIALDGALIISRLLYSMSILPKLLTHFNNFFNRNNGLKNEQFI